MIRYSTTIPATAPTWIFVARERLNHHLQAEPAPAAEAAPPRFSWREPICRFSRSQ
jgi:hypothetical protein